jgi:hypothetical protein
VNDTEEAEDLEEETEDIDAPAEGGPRVGSSATNYSKVNVRKELFKSDRRLEKLTSMKECLRSQPFNYALKEQASAAVVAWKDGSLNDTLLD